ncbi:unnamed protein product, partial [Boreogadus saida]
MPIKTTRAVEDRSQEPAGSASGGVRPPAESPPPGRAEDEEEEEEDEEDEEERRMLASLRRGSEEDGDDGEKGGAGPGPRGLSASQIHRCGVSISISSDDASSFSSAPPPASNATMWQHVLILGAHGVCFPHGHRSSVRGIQRPPFGPFSALGDEEQPSSLLLLQKPPHPSQQGFYYQKEMTPLRSSNPREWMDVISPPIFPGRRHEKTGSVQHHHRNLIR